MLGKTKSPLDRFADQELISDRYREMLMRIVFRFTLLVLLVLTSMNASLAQWTQVSNPTGVRINCFAVSGTNLFAGTNGAGIFLSTDNGTSWTAVNTGLPPAGSTTTTISSLTVSGTNLFAGTFGGDLAGTFGRGVFLSTNNGMSWTAVSNGLPTNTSCNCLAIAPNGAGGMNIFLGTDVNGIFLSTNSGISWTSAGLQNYWITVLTVSGTNLFAGTAGSGAFLSTNNGISWKTASIGLTNTTVVALAVSGKNLFAGTYGGGVFLSTNNGASWTQVNTGLTNTYINVFAVSGTNLFAGTDGGVFRRPLTDWMSLLTPEYGLGGIALPTTFKWKTNSQALAYDIQISTDAGFSNFVVNQYTTDTIYTVSNLQLATVYYWRVRAENATWASEWGSSSFTTKLTNAPQLLSPSSGANLVSVTPTLSWNPVASTASYTLQVSTRLAFDTQVFSKDTTSTSIVSPQLQRSTAYYWRVRAQTIGDTTAWSSISNFTTVPNAPNRITLVYPDSNKQDTYPNDWFIWQTDTTATSYLIQISQSPLFTTIYDSATVKSAGYRSSTKIFTTGSTYFWRVRGSNIGGVGPFFSVWPFKVGNAVRVPVSFYSSSNLDYGRVKVGQYKDTVVTVSNNGNDTLKISKISSSVGSFSTRPTAWTLPSSQSFIDTIRFTPTKAGADTARIVITSNASSSPDTVVVTGFGLSYGLSLNAKIISLGTAKVGSIKDSLLTITNTGNDNLVISSITSSKSSFIPKSTSLTIAAGQTAKDTIGFAPASAGADTARIIIISNTPTSPDTVIVTGYGATYSFTLSNRIVTFPNTKVGTRRDTSFAITNIGNQSLVVSDINSSNTMFSVSSKQFAVSPGANIKDTLSFTPSTFGSTTAKIIILSNASSSPDTISVTGMGATTGVLSELGVPKEYTLSQNYPNPYNPSTTIQYGLPARSSVRLVIYNMLGQIVKELVNTEQLAGYQSVK